MGKNMHLGWVSATGGRRSTHGNAPEASESKHHHYRKDLDADSLGLLIDLDKTV